MNDAQQLSSDSAVFGDACETCGEVGARYFLKDSHGRTVGPWHRFCIPFESASHMAYCPHTKKAEGVIFKTEQLTPEKMHSMFVEAHWAVRNLAKALKVVGYPIGLGPISHLMDCTNELFGEISKRDEQIKYLKSQLAQERKKVVALDAATASKNRNQRGGNDPSNKPASHDASGDN